MVGKRSATVVAALFGAATTVSAVATPAVATPAVALARSAPSYHSPGYRGKTAFPRVVATPLPAITLGTGKYPSLFVDPAGTAHIAFAQDGGAAAPDAIAYCGLQRGRRSCAQTSPVTSPQAPDPSQGGVFAGNIPSGNHDFDGPVPLDIGNQLFIVDRRFPDLFNTPDMSTSESNVFEWSSVDGGANITGPGTIGDNEMGGGAIAYGGTANPSIGTISRTQTVGTFFQGVPAGQYTRAKAQLGSPDQAYDGSLAVDGTLPVAAFANAAETTTFVREWSGQGDVNDATNWSQASFAGASPQLAGGPSGVFVLYRDGSLSGSSNVLIRRIVGGQPSGGPVKLSGPVGNPTISEDPGGHLAVAYVDSAGIEVRSSSDGIHWSSPQLTALVPSGGSVGHLAVAATADGGGFVSFVKNPAGAEGVGTVVASAFGTQQATRQPGLGTLPGGGIGSQIGDQLATSTCSTAKFGVVTVQIKAGCFAHDPQDPQLDVSLGEININGISIIPDFGVKIGIDPKLHTIDTTGSVSVVLKGQEINVTIWHGELHVKIPVATPGADLFDFSELAPPDLAGFPIDGSVDVKLINGGVQVPVSLKLPAYFGGVTGSATLEATLNGGLNLDSLEFKIGDANFGALELKDVDVTYTRAGSKWSGSGTINVPTGGSALSLKLAIEFDNGNFTSGSFDVGLPYPGVPFDLNDTPPQLYLTHGGLGLGLSPPSLSGTIGFGITPVSAVGAGGQHDYAFSLDGKLTAAFGDPVTITVTATGFAYQLQITNATLTYKIPDQVTLTGSSGYDLGVVESKGTFSAIIDPKDNKFGGQISSDLIIHVSKLGLSSVLPANVLDAGDITIPSEKIAINNNGFGVYVPPGAATPIPFFGTITYRWGDPYPTPHPGSQDLSEFTTAVPAADIAGRSAHAAAGMSFQIPARTSSAALEVSGAGGAPAVVLSAPNGAQIVPSTTFATGAAAFALGDATANLTHVGLVHPAAGRWTVQQATGSSIAITGVKYAIGEQAPTVTARLTGNTTTRTLHYQVKLPRNVTVEFAEQTRNLFHIIGNATKATGTIRFTPAFGPAGRRQIVALIDNGGLPSSTKVLASFLAARPARPGRARHLSVRAGARAFTVSFVAPANAMRTLVVIVASDGRHLQRLLPVRTHKLSVPVIGYRDGVTVTVIGIDAAGRRGPAVRASAKRAQ